MVELEEFRYPFTSAYEFFASYFRDPLALHLSFSWVAIVAVGIRVMLAKTGLGKKLLALYFGLTLFNNYAFQIIPGATLGDVFGVACTFYFGVMLVTKLQFRVHIPVVGVSIVTIGILISAHAALIAAIYPEVNGDGAGMTRLLIISKIFVLGACCCLANEVLEDEAQIAWLIRRIVDFAIIGLIAYAIQICILLTGKLPYGTFFDAGFIGFPSFGSVSIERGHFGKFMTPLFPLFLFSLLRHKRTKTFLSFVCVTVINFSASSLSFFGFYLAVSLFQLRRKLLNVKVAFVTITILLVFIGFVACSWQLWVAIVSKIYLCAFQGDSEGGRGIGIFLTYIQAYPLGLSYGGSSLRIAPGMDEINSGLFSFVTQESILAVPILIGFFWLIFRCLHSCRDIQDPDIRNVLMAGILIMPFIFATDTLWFVPTIWLPMLLAYRLSQSNLNLARTTQMTSSSAESLGAAMLRVI